MDSHDYIERRIKQEIEVCMALGNTITLSRECRELLENFLLDYRAKYEGIGLHAHVAYFLHVDTISTRSK